MAGRRWEAVLLARGQQRCAGRRGPQKQASGPNLSPLSSPSPSAVSGFLPSVARGTVDNYGLPTRKWRVKKVGLKLNIQKMKITASGPIISWEIDGKTVETVADFKLLGGSKITADGDCSHEIKRHLLLGRKVMTNLLLLLSRISHVQLFATP